jgi:glutaredoxin 3
LKIVIYTKKTCAYCMMAKRLLQSKGVEWDEINIAADLEQRHEMFERSGRRTVPQIFVGDLHVGGFDDLAALEDAGRLDVILEASNDQTEQEE